MINGYASDEKPVEGCSNYCLNNGICVMNQDMRQCYCLPG